MALKIIDVGIFLFLISLKYLFPLIFYLGGGKTYKPALVNKKVEYLSVWQEGQSRAWTEYQHLTTWKTVPGCGRPCKKRADDLLKLGRHQLKMAVAILTGHASVRGHLRIMGLFSGDPSCRFCKMETETVQHITCCCEALA